MSSFRNALAAGLLLAATPALADNHQSWTGFYAGVGIGSSWSSVDWKTTAIGNPLGAADGQTDGQSFDVDGFRFDGILGYSQALSGNLVVGFEGELGLRAGGDDNKGFIPGTVFGPPPGNAGDSAGVDLGWDGALLLRAGLLVTPTTLLYATGGLAIIDVEVLASCTVQSATVGNWCTRKVDRSQSESDIKVGWTLGAGLEMAIGQGLALRGEYRYSDYGTLDTTFFVGTGDDVRTSVDLEIHTLKVDLVRRF